MTSVVVSDGGGNLVEYVTVVEESQQVSTTLFNFSFISLTVWNTYYYCSSNDAVIIIKIACCNCVIACFPSFLNVSSVSSSLLKRRNRRRKWFSRKLRQ